MDMKIFHGLGRKVCLEMYNTHFFLHCESINDFECRKN